MINRSIYHQYATRVSVLSVLTILINIVHANAVLPIPEESIESSLQNEQDKNNQQNNTILNQNIVAASYNQLPDQGNIISEDSLTSDTLHDINEYNHNNEYGMNDTGQKRDFNEEALDRQEVLDKKIVAYLVTLDVNGQEQLISVTPTTQVNSGDILEYQTTVTNTTPDHMSSMTLSINIPEELELIGNIAPEYALGSSDGSSFQYMPLRAYINGILKDLPLSYYKSIRWNLNELDLNESVTVTYRAKYK